MTEQQQGAPVPAPVDEKKKQELIQKLLDTVIIMANQGKSKEETVKKLIEMGLDPAEAPAFVDAALLKATQQAELEKATPQAILPAVIGGLVVAIICGIFWGWLAKETEKEYGYAALAVGWLCGGAVFLITGKKKGLSLQLIASFFSLFGIFVGKYVMYILQVKEVLITKEGMKPEEVTAGVLLSPGVTQIFFQNVASFFGGFDLLWLVLAVSVCWGMLSPVLKKTK